MNLDKWKVMKYCITLVFTLTVLSHVMARAYDPRGPGRSWLITPFIVGICSDRLFFTESGAGLNIPRPLIGAWSRGSVKDKWVFHFLFFILR